MKPRPGPDSEQPKSAISLSFPARWGLSRARGFCSIFSSALFVLVVLGWNEVSSWCYNHVDRTPYGAATSRAGDQLARCDAIRRVGGMAKILSSFRILFGLGFHATFRPIGCCCHGDWLLFSERSLSSSPSPDIAIFVSKPRNSATRVGDNTWKISIELCPKIMRKPKKC